MQTTTTVFLFQFSQIEATICKYNEYTIESVAGKLTCLTCHTHPAGFGLFLQCGARVKDNKSRNECKLCLLGKTYSAHEDKSSHEPFKPCTRCFIGQKEVLPCNLENDINELKTCSAYCNNDKDMHVEQCTEQKMPKKFKCNYCDRGGNQRSEEQKSIFPFSLVYVVAVGIVILVTIILSVIYPCRRFCRQVTITLDESNSLLPSHEEKGVNCLSNYNFLLS